MKDFARQLTQKCVSMGLLDESYSEWFAYSIEKRVTTLLTFNSEIHKRLSCCHL